MSVQTSAQTDTCAQCAYWKPQASEASENGECRRQPPQAITFKVDSETKFETRFPETMASDWCGEFKAK